MYIIHDSRNIRYREPFGAVTTGTEVRISAEMGEADVERARLMVWHGKALSPHYYEMKEGEPGSGLYSTSFKAPDEGVLLWYAFEVKASDHGGDFTVYFGKNRANYGGGGDFYESSPECWQITVYKPSEVPSWYRDGIVYQIFPDRFARDEDWKERTEAAIERVNSRRSDTKRVLQEDWTRPAYYVRDGSGQVVEWPMYGGSLKGIEQKLDYIRSLGVSCIYLNPVFEATSNHRYDTGDYMKIESALGTDEDFESLCETARARGIRIMLDGVFSHTGADSIYFDKYGNYLSDGDEKARASQGAWQSEDSPFRSWFRFDDSEAGYSSWWGVTDLPEVEETDEGYRKYILGEDGVVAHWMKKGASAWRLDVADELPDSFIEETRQRVKGFSSESVLIGEVWEDASNKISYDERRRYLLGDELDGTMNYPLRDLLLDYINYTISAGGAAEKLMQLKENYPEPAFYSALNLIGSHDRERIITAMAGEQDYESAVRKVKVLSALQFALPGVPCIYYGDEVGLMGGTDPANRSGYPWKFENLDLGYHYRMLGLLYDEHPALANGSFELLSLGDDIFAFTRKGRDAAGCEETILVLANRRYGEADVDLRGIEQLKGTYALELLTSEEIKPGSDGSPGVVHMERLSVKMISIRAERPKSEGFRKAAGVVCHISSLGTSSLGKSARDFVDFLASAGFSIWQVLPLNPPGMGNSPYSSYAAFAGEPGFIDTDELPGDDGFKGFVKANSFWLNDYTAYTVIKESQDNKPWYEWPDELKFADSEKYLASLSGSRKERTDELFKEQYWFYAQWNALRSYAASKGVRIMGDLPMFMAADSADVWANKKIFRMDEFGRQRVHAGVPPDAFSGVGQDWGNPLYDWDELKNEGYDWWMKRIKQCAERFDILRIDHFRGMSEYYAIPEGKEPKDGCWQHGPGLGFIAAIHEMLHREGLDMKLLAEDLGFLDAGVKNLMKLSGLPGMDIWQFTAGEMMEMCRTEPEKAVNRAFYTGTHDNDTLPGWLSEGESRPEEPDKDEDEAPKPVSDEVRNKAREIIKKIYESPASLAMLQLQDVFMLGSDSRMNVPGVPDGNWSWKIPGASIHEAFADADEAAAWFKELAEATGRIPV